jgi:hypothetical protein
MNTSAPKQVALYARVSTKGLGQDPEGAVWGGPARHSRSPPAPSRAPTLEPPTLSVSGAVAYLRRVQATP